jgi:hypothetical protein
MAKTIQAEGMGLLRIVSERPPLLPFGLVFSFREADKRATTLHASEGHGNNRDHDYRRSRIR